MKTFLILIALAFIAYLVIQKLKESEKADLKIEKPKEDIGKYYYLKKSLFTPTEHTFFQELQKQNNGQFMINSKVRMEDIVGVGKGVGNRYREMRNHIKSRHVDFVINDLSGKTLAVIELDDKSHESEKAQYGDEIKNQIFSFVRVKFYRVKIGETYSEKIENIFEETKRA